jgi:hypothetical protein
MASDAVSGNEYTRSIIQKEVRRQMRKRQVLIGLAITMALLGVPLALYAQETDPVQVCYGPAYEAFLAGEQACDPSIWAADAVQTSIMGNMVTTYAGVDQICAHFEELLANGFTMEVTVQSVEGGTVTSESKVWDNDTRALGVAPLVGTEVCIVQDGKIQSLTWTMSESSQAALGAALAALPQTGGGPLPNYAWIMAVGAVTLVAGLGARFVGGGVRHGM